MALTTAERSKRKRDKKKESGLIKVEMYLTPTKAKKVRAFASSLS